MNTENMTNPKKNLIITLLQAKASTARTNSLIVRAAMATFTCTMLANAHNSMTYYLVMIATAIFFLAEYGQQLNALVIEKEIYMLISQNHTEVCDKIDNKQPITLQWKNELLATLNDRSLLFYSLFLALESLLFINYYPCTSSVIILVASLALSGVSIYFSIKQNTKHQDILLFRNI